MKIINKPLLKMILISLSLTIPSVTMAKVYKWTDEQGKVHYTATPPPAKLKTKSKEFKVNKVKSSSLTNSSSSSEDTDTNSEKFAVNKCEKALEKVPQLLKQMEKVVEEAYSTGKISEKDYKLANIHIKEERSKPKATVSECLKDYNAGGREKNDILNLANNSVEDAFQLMAMGAALEQAEQRINNKNKN